MSTSYLARRGAKRVANSNDIIINRACYCKTRWWLEKWWKGNNIINNININNINIIHSKGNNIIINRAKLDGGRKSGRRVTGVRHTWDPP